MLEAALQRAWLRRGPLALALLPLAATFGLLGALRRGLYRTGLLRAHQLPVPVIVVGNVVAGGAGKTPVVMALVVEAVLVLVQRLTTPWMRSTSRARR